MYRFLLRPRWIAFTLLVVAAVVLMVNLGFWQLRRLDERKGFNATVRDRADAEAIQVEDVLRMGSDPDELDWTPVVAVGAYEADEQVLIVNRSQDGMAGLNVVTPLRLDDGTAILVNRGFVPLAEDPPAAPEGSVTVTGLLRESQERGFGGASDPSDGELAEAQRIDIDRLAPQIDGEVLPMWLSLETSDPAQGDRPVPLPRPELTEGPHLSYAVQWFLFSAAAIVGWVLAVRHSARTRRAANASTS
jgi:cytochrome oxidase assembly protein ShyY1